MGQCQSHSPRPLQSRSILTHFRLKRSAGCWATTNPCSRQPPMSAEKRARFRQWLERGEACLHPLTLPQRELWETSSAPAGDVSNHICCVINVRGLITPEDCVASLERVVNRQKVLRLSILPGKNGPVQLIRARAEPVMRLAISRRRHRLRKSKSLPSKLSPSHSI